MEALGEQALDGLADGQLLAVIDIALDVLSQDRLGSPSDAERLDLLLGVLRLGARVAALEQGMAAGVESSEAAWNEHRTSTVTWLADRMNLTPREAVRLVRAGQGLARFPIVAAAAGRGEMLAQQAEAITTVLANLPGELPGEVVARGEQHLVALAASHNSVELRRLSGHLLEVLAPEAAEGLEAARLERELRMARAGRHLEFRGDGQGSVLIRGSLPVVDAEAFIRVVDAYAAAGKRAIDAIDPVAETLTPSMRRADGLLAMVAHHGQQSLAPTNGGDRPRIVLTLSYDKLVKACVDAGLVRAGEPVAASLARQLLCDGDLLPVVLGGASEILDVGRTQRLVTPPIRAALELRDGGCVFPGCDKPPEACHAHHILPWHAGGATKLSNLTLLCPHHHGIVEPGHDPSSDRWQVRIGCKTTPEILPPKRVDPNREPRQHARFQTPRRR